MYFIPANPDSAVSRRFQPVPSVSRLAGGDYIITHIPHTCLPKSCFIGKLSEITTSDRWTMVLWVRTSVAAAFLISRHSFVGKLLDSCVQHWSECFVDNIGPIQDTYIGSSSLLSKISLDTHDNLHEGMRWVRIAIFTTYLLRENKDMFFSVDEIESYGKVSFCNLRVECIWLYQN